MNTIVNRSALLAALFAISAGGALAQSSPQGPQTFDHIVWPPRHAGCAWSILVWLQVYEEVCSQGRQDEHKVVLDTIIAKLEARIEAKRTASRAPEVSEKAKRYLRSFIRDGIEKNRYCEEGLVRDVSRAYRQEDAHKFSAMIAELPFDQPLDSSSTDKVCFKQ